MNNDLNKTEAYFSSSCERPEVGNFQQVWKTGSMQSLEI